MVKITIENDNITITDPTESLIELAVYALSYKDKSKEYQIRKMMKNPWRRNSPELKQLQEGVYGQVYRFHGNTLSIPSALLYIIKEEIKSADISDKRKETGKTIALPWVKKPYDLREYQEEGVTLALSNWRGLLNLSTGLGKTLIATHLIKRYKKKSLVVCPSESVAKQFYEQLVDCFGSNRVGFFGGGKKKIKDITVGIAASIHKNTKEFKDADLGLIIVDEVHHLAANTFYNITSELASVGKIIGLTATDYRSDGKDILINSGCGEVLLRRDVKWGVENGWLAEPYFIVREIRTGGKDIKDDKLRSYKEHILNSTITKNIIKSDAERMMAAGKQVLVLVDEVSHGRELSEQLGIPFATGEDKRSQEYVDQLNAGKVKGLVGTDGKISEGTDTKNVDVLILANFMASKGPVMQAVGRGLRKQGSKTKCLVLDYKIMDSTMLSRHCDSRISYYKEITNKIKITKE
jgi:superfamily II DNA or RNA helicase